VALADFNGDGKPDLVVANLISDTVSVLLNTTAAGATTPSFTAHETFATGGLPQSVAVADVNADGKPDLVVANESGIGTVSVLLNTTAPGATTPSFAPQETFATGSESISVAVADFNGDGKPDLVVANANSSSVSVLLNTTAPGATTPSFATQETFATGSVPQSVAVADFNGDGRPDLVVANRNPNTVSVLLNTTTPGATTPSFATQETFATGSGPLSVAVADVNGDGRPDLVVANRGSDTVSVLLNTTTPGATTPSFAAQETFATGSNPFFVAVADLNGDGKPDLAVANLNDNTVSVLLNNVVPIALDGSPATGTIEDDDAPVTMTIAAGNNQSATVNTAFMTNLAVDVENAAGHLVQGVSVTFTAPASGASGTFGGSATVLTDASGRATAPTLTANQTAGAYTVTASTTEGTQPSVSFNLTNTPVLTAVGADAGDGPEVKVFDSSGTQVASFFAFDPGFQGGVRVAVGDVNGDGVPDLIVAAGPGGGPHVKIIDGTKLSMVDTNGEIDDATLLASFYAYDPGFAGGVFVAFGLSNGLPQIITGADAGGGPHVKVIDGAEIKTVESNGEISDGALVGQFYAYDPAFGGGVRVAAANLNNDGILDIITGAGPGGGPHVKAIDGTKLSQLQNNAEISDTALLGQFYAYTPTVAPSGGVYVAATDIGGHPIIITGDGPVSSGAVDGPRVKVIDATKLDLLDSNGEPTGAALLGNFFAYDPGFGGGVSVGAADLNGDGVADIITGAGPGGGPHVKVVNGTDLTNLQPNGEIADAALLDSFYAFSQTFAGGVFVGGGAA
jgi:hypothetical protein